MLTLASLWIIILFPVTVLHDNPTQADAWSTALLCLGKTKGLEVANQAGIAVLFIEQQGDNFNEYRSTPFRCVKAD